ANDRRLGHPVRAFVVNDPDRLQVSHDPREVFEVAPVGVGFLRRLADQEGLRHVHAVLVKIFGADALVGGIDVHGAVERAAAGGAAVNQCAADGGDGAAGEVAASEAQQRGNRAGGD